MSTLAVAIQARQWKTAKVILAIASAQYEKADKEEPTYQYDDSDEDSECDTTMGLDEEEEEISKPVLIDLSHRLSTVKVPVGPQRLFEANRVIRGSTETLETPIDRALQDGDVTVLEHVLELGKLCEPKQELLPSHLNSALLSDSPEILDLVIRRYGYGISFDEEEDDHDELGQEGRPKVSKVYLGLNVDGKKRKDLASKADPDAPRQGNTNYVPFIWRAARMNKGKVLSWLASPAPLEAYRHFMLNSTHENATSLKRIRDFDQGFPALIGSTVTDVGENVLVAYLQSGAELATVRQIFSLFPGLKTTFVHGKLKGLETTALHQICGANLSPEIFDFFIGMGADPLGTDFKRCNIVHQLVAKNNYDLLVHVCTKLSKDQLAILFSQQSKPQMNTPLHLAVRTGRRHLVELLLAFDHPVTEVTLALRNAEGSTPLHIAVAAGFQKITSLLLDKELSASSKTLFIENGIGSTPLETVVFLRLLDISSSRFANPVVPTTFDECAGYDFDMSRNWGSLPISAYARSSLVDRIGGRGNTNSSTPEGTQSLDQLLQSLDAEGRFKEQPEVRNVLFDYAARCHTAIPQWEAMDQSKKEFLEQEDARANNGVVVSKSSMTVEKLKEIRGNLAARTYLRPNSTLLTSGTTESVQDTDTCDIEGTYKLIKSAIDSSPFKQRRELVHLLDAQRAVNTALDSAIKSSDSQPTFQFGQLEDPYRWLTAKQRLNQLEKQDLDAKEEAAYRFQLELGWLMIADA
ncbi:hypothetical protein FRC17_006140 [Serendipita sp. 399]|nr:hypothetical protein FRC17_006140 [Serendipita sp. 399]